ncbi:MAG: hypothetical protein EPN47_20515 [Acidobacteria bacterium]|nr:MAG: hypothetical protein EPN47_20515 [Acidobacteriota bacterium]
MLGWALIPEHFHLLVWPFQRADPSQVVQSLKERTAKFASSHLRRNADYGWCARMLGKLAWNGSSPFHAPRLAAAFL